MLGKVKGFLKKCFGGFKMYLEGLQMLVDEDSKMLEDSKTCLLPGFPTFHPQI